MALQGNEEGADRSELPEFPYSGNFEAGVRFLRRMREGKRKYKKRAPKNPPIEAASLPIETTSDDESLKLKDEPEDLEHYQASPPNVPQQEFTRWSILEEVGAIGICILYFVLLQYFLQCRYQIPN